MKTTAWDIAAELDSGVGMCECLIYDDHYRTVNGCVPRVHSQSICRTVKQTDNVTVSRRDGRRMGTTKTEGRRHVWETEDGSQI
jgi:hypothetical protein